MKLLDDFLSGRWLTRDMKPQLLAFLASGEAELRVLGGKPLTRAQACELLQELIPAGITVLRVCRGPAAVVVAAPHAGFDNWSEFFSNRLARRFHTGWVVARNYRDQNGRAIPVSIGRHLHVNRPTESLRRAGPEFESDRAREVHTRYCEALREASGRPSLPLDLLIELHSHHRTPYLEIATVGVSVEQAGALAAAYDEARRVAPALPELRIEPLHELRMSADRTKQSGSLRPEIARRALHIEVPREARQSDLLRRLMCRALFRLSTAALDSLVDPSSGAAATP